MADIVTKLSPRPVAATVARFTDLLAGKGVKVFAVIDQAAEAREAGQTKVSYTAPAAIGARYGLPDNLAANLAAINPLTDALIAP
jgi:hypothetical protein